MLYTKIFNFSILEQTTDREQQTTIIMIICGIYLSVTERVNSAKSQQQQQQKQEQLFKHLLLATLVNICVCGFVVMHIFYKQ